MMLPRTYQHVTWEHRDGVTMLRFHTEGGSLVWAPKAHREIGDAFLEVAADRATKVVVITGTGASFCAELDARGFAAAVRDGWDEIWWEGKRLLRALLDIDVPVIGAVNGPATVHAELSVLADIVLAADTATFQDSAHFSHGAVPGDGVHLVWPQLLGDKRAKYFLLTGSVIDAADAKAIGFVDELLAPELLLERAWELGHELADRASRAALRYTREALNFRMREILNAGLSHGLVLEGAAILQDSIARSREPAARRP
jgi:enoyl-CoA hydratase/carnithine racemase